MEIVNFGHFQAHASDSILLFTNADGQDWYDLRAALTTWDIDGSFVDAIYGAWALVDPAGVITNVEYDPSRLVPADRTVLGIDANWTDVTPGHLYLDGEIVPPPAPTADELRATFPELRPTTFWKAAREIGVYKADVIAQINAIEDLGDREDALIDIEECLGFLRLNPLVVSFTSTYNITPEQLDDLWLWAANTQA
ncbi:class II glutamine amidotransferase [Rhizobium leguminosarum]|uniref:class II glutamine amidotransferase n=1 Tax=Rhizobium leguminosarum TaxID=384 RepID=UPI001C944995|nr:class II glutamine amidotransferase [Rhizobium leguminosarum]MBY5581864.1 hypothetical protein [Rhizobium leguminosarum]